METRELISLIKFVLYGNCNVEQINNYAYFLNKKLELGFFIPCDKEGKILEEPRSAYIYKTMTGECSSDEMRLNREYQEAKDRVIFEGFEVIEISRNLRIIKNTKADCQVFANQYRNYYYKCNQFETIEDLTKLGLTITPQAIKKYNLTKTERMKNIEEILNRLEFKYNQSIYNQKQKLLSKILFEFDLVHHFDYSGWCVLNVKTSNLVLLSTCLNHIKKHKTLDEKSHKKLST